MKRGRLNDFQEEDFIRIVKTSESVTDALLKFGLQNKGSNYKTLKYKMKTFGLSYEDLKNKGKQVLCDKLRQYNFKRRQKLENLLVENSTYPRVH